MHRQVAWVIVTTADAGATTAGGAALEDIYPFQRSKQKGGVLVAGKEGLR